MSTIIFPDQHLILEDLLPHHLRNSWNIPAQFHPMLQEYTVHYYEWRAFWCRASADLYFPMREHQYKILASGAQRGAQRGTGCIKLKPWIAASFRKPLNAKLCGPVVIIHTCSAPPQK